MRPVSAVPERRWHISILDLMVVTTGIAISSTLALHIELWEIRVLILSGTVGGVLNQGLIPGRLASYVLGFAYGFGIPVFLFVLIIFLLGSF